MTVAYELGKGVDEYITSHNRLQHAVWCEFLSWRYGRKDDDSSDEDDQPSQYARDEGGVPSAITPEMERYLREGYAPSGKTPPTTPHTISTPANEGGHSSPESFTGNQPGPYSDPAMQEMTRRFWDRIKRAREGKLTRQEQFEIDFNKVAFAQRVGKEL